MQKVFDKLILSFITFLIVFIVCRLLKIKLLLSVAISFFSMFLVFIVLYLAFRSQKNNMSYNNFIKSIIINDKSHVLSLFNSVYDQRLQVFDKYITIDNKAYFLNLKFSNPSADALVDIYRICQQNNLTTATILCKEKDKKFYIFYNMFDDVRFDFNSYKFLYAQLKKSNMLPCSKQSDKPSILYVLRITLSYAFQRKNCKHYLFASFVMCLFSFITPLSTYYLIMAGISVGLSIICLFRL